MPCHSNSHTSGSPAVWLCVSFPFSCLSCDICQSDSSLRFLKPAAERIIPIPAIPNIISSIPLWRLSPVFGNAVSGTSSSSINSVTGSAGRSASGTSGVSIVVVVRGVRPPPPPPPLLPPPPGGVVGGVWGSSGSLGSSGGVETSFSRKPTSIFHSVFW